MTNLVTYENENRIGRITLNNPDKSNPITREILVKLVRLFKESADNNDSCVIYRANGKNFTFGADLKYGYELMGDPSRRSEAADYLWYWQELTSVMLDHPGIIIVGYHGWIVGGGFEHTLTCDMRIAADNTRIMMPELDIGIFFSNASTRLLPQIVGAGKARELMILGEEIDVAEALRIGLVNRVCPVDQLDNVLNDIANRIAGKEPQALRLAKQLLNEAQEKSIDEMLYREGRAMIQTGQSDAAVSRIKAFLEMKS